MYPKTEDYESVKTPPAPRATDEWLQTSGAEDASFVSDVVQ